MWLGSAGAAPAVVKGGAADLLGELGVGSASGGPCHHERLLPRLLRPAPARVRRARPCRQHHPRLGPVRRLSHPHRMADPQRFGGHPRRPPRHLDVRPGRSHAGPRLRSLPGLRTPQPRPGLPLRDRGARTRLPLTRLSAPVAHRRCPELRDCRVWLRSLPVTASIDELQQRLAIQGLSDVHEKCHRPRVTGRVQRLTVPTRTKSAVRTAARVIAITAGTPRTRRSTGRC